MANLQLYTTAAVYLDDQLLSEAMSISVKTNGNHQSQKTLAKGYAGESKGAVTTEISVSNAVPQAGFEFDLQDRINNLIQSKITIFAASKTMTINGFFKSGTFDKAVDSEAKISFEFMGGEALFE